MRPGRNWIFNFAIVGAILVLVYAGAEFAFDWAAKNRIENLRQEKSAIAGKWFIEEGASRRFDGRAFIMASASSALVDAIHFYDLSLICYGPGETGASLLVLVYKVTITADGLGAYPLGAGDRAELVRTGGEADYSVMLEYAAASEALEIRLGGDGSGDPEKIFAGRYSSESPLLIRAADGGVAFVDSTESGHRTRRQVLDACSTESAVR